MDYPEKEKSAGALHNEEFLVLTERLLHLSTSELQMCRAEYRSQLVKMQMPDMADIFNQLCESVLRYHDVVTTNAFCAGEALDKIAVSL